jgi:hypothetical protein
VILFILRTLQSFREFFFEGGKLRSPFRIGIHLPKGRSVYARYVTPSLPTDMKMQELIHQIFRRYQHIFLVPERTMPQLGRKKLYCTHYCMSLTKYHNNSHLSWSYHHVCILPASAVRDGRNDHRHQSHPGKPKTSSHHRSTLMTAYHSYAQNEVLKEKCRGMKKILKFQTCVVRLQMTIVPQKLQ